MGFVFGLIAFLSVESLKKEVKELKEANNSKKDK